MQPMMMEPRALSPEADKLEAYGFDVMNRRASAAAPGRAQAWFEVESVEVFDQWGKSTGREPRVMFRMRSFSDPQSVFSVPKMPAHERMYARQWAAFVQGQEDVPNGTPIDEMPRVSRLLRETLRAMGVVTIEQAADLPEQARQRLGLEGDRVREIARAWLAKEAGGDVADYAGENATLKQQVEAMERERAALAAELAATKLVIGSLGAQGGAQAAAVSRVTVETNPDYSDMPYDALAGSDAGDDDPMDNLVG